MCEAGWRCEKGSGVVPVVSGTTRVRPGGDVAPSRTASGDGGVWARRGGGGKGGGGGAGCFRDEAGASGGMTWRRRGRPGGFGEWSGGGLRCVEGGGGRRGRRRGVEYGRGRRRVGGELVSAGVVTRALGATYLPCRLSSGGWESVGGCVARRVDAKRRRRRWRRAASDGRWWGQWVRG